MINNNSGNLNWNPNDQAQFLRQQFDSTVSMPLQSGYVSHFPNNICRQFDSSSVQTVPEKYMTNTKDKRFVDTNFNIKTKVRVQHLQMHSKLQKNRWNLRSFCDYAVNGETNMPNINENFNQKESAFKDHKFNNKEMTGFSKFGTSNASNAYASKRILDSVCDNFKETDERIGHVCRTEYQENAFRRIEDVHNYSKPNPDIYTNDTSSNSSPEDDMDEEDERDEIVDEAIHESGDGFFEYRHKIRKSMDSQKNNVYSVNTANESNCKTQNQSLSERRDGSDNPNRPDHHARRPMNAFLIFCKRHRAIVKDKYKSLENRAITKILGDWWASLDLNEKKCYTSLAQQNKDAFFNANPNFKWYKLPAPPLRTLNTRPNNTEHKDCIRDVPSTDDHSIEEHVFKLADETQMGDLSALLGERDRAAQGNLSSDVRKTQKCMRHVDADSLNCGYSEFGVDCKRDGPMMNTTPIINDNEEGFSSKKTTRLCKGRIYRELISSGQISAVPKRKVLKVDCIDEFDERNCFIANGVSVKIPLPSYPCSSVAQLIKQKEKHVDNREYINPSTDSAMHFDLDEKISELPALSLDIYLQRKRNNQKKKKTTSKKRFPSLTRKSQLKATSTSSSLPITLNRSAVDPSTQAVGSQKRKAKKESITRRDVSAIENEVASLLSFQADFDAASCSRNYFCNDNSLTWSTINPLTSKPESDFTSTEFSIKPRSNELSNLSNNVNISNSNNNSPTSDLLILAEAAAKRTSEVSET